MAERSTRISIVGGMAIAAVAAMGLSSSMAAAGERAAVTPQSAAVEKAEAKMRRQVDRALRRHRRTVPHNGNREVDRRLRQIEAGQLTESNGLVRHG